MFFNCILEEREGSNSFERLSCGFVSRSSVVLTAAFCLITFSSLKMNLKKDSTKQESSDLNSGFTVFIQTTNVYHMLHCVLVIGVKGVL